MCNMELRRKKRGGHGEMKERKRRRLIILNRDFIAVLSALSLSFSFFSLVLSLVLSCLVKCYLICTTGVLNAGWRAADKVSPHWSWDALKCLLHANSTTMERDETFFFFKHFLSHLFGSAPFSLPFLNDVIFLLFSFSSVSHCLGLCSRVSTPHPAVCGHSSIS